MNAFVGEGLQKQQTTANLPGIGQYAAIALILIAKSIARYDVLEDTSFVEYFLPGT
jgi:adenine-specific DNA glycosylase